MPKPRKMPIEMFTTYITNATEGNKGLLLMDSELLFEINKQAKPEERISLRTFQRYKTVAMAYGEEYLEETAYGFSQSYQDLFDALMDNRIKQKLNLYEKVMNSEPADSRNYKWIMERKFPELNLRVVMHKAMAEYEMFEKKNQMADLEDMKADYQRFMVSREREDRRQHIGYLNNNAPQQNHTETRTAPAPVKQSATQAAVAAPIAAAVRPPVKEYSHLWKKPDGSRRTQKEFVLAVMAAKAKE